MILSFGGLGLRVVGFRLWGFKVERPPAPKS